MGGPQIALAAEAKPIDARGPAPEPELSSLLFLRDCVDDAQEAINGLWDARANTFWRSTLHRERERAKRPRRFYPTATLRCVHALLFVASESPSWLSRNTSSAIAKEYVPGILRRKTTDLLQSSLNLTEDRTNIFTLAVFASTFALIIRTLPSDDPQRKPALKQLERAVQEICRHPSLTRAGLNELHPFLCSWVRRALKGSASQLGRKVNARIDSVTRRIERNCRSTISTNLAKDAVGTLNPSEAVALIFSAAGLVQRSDHAVPTIAREDLALVRTALEVCLAAQDDTGCWPLGRVVEANKDISSQRLEISTFEVISAVAEVVSALLHAVDERYVDKLSRVAASKLIKSGYYAERSVVRLETSGMPRVGWCSDHAYGLRMVESWTSATVLEAMIQVDLALHEFNQRRILSGLSVNDPRGREWPTWLRWSRFKSEGEIDSERPVLAYLDEAFVQPIRRDPRGLPSVQAGTVSGLLFGPPGTSKTTLAKGVADGLGWPVLALSPGTFIERGLEYIESQARHVFDRLNELARVVVIFDECDELFRDRQPLPESEQMRGITAFVTASMLPKLQDLHDRAKLVFFVCTNNFDAMDPAIKRGGRIDHIVGVGPMDRYARKRAINSFLDVARKSDRWTDVPMLSEACAELAQVTQLFTRPELERALSAMIKRGRIKPWAKPSAARAVARKVSEEYRGGLTITQKDYDDFIAQCKKFSRPYLAE